jgi:hypothetical protein
VVESFKIKNEPDTVANFIRTIEKDFDQLHGINEIKSNEIFDDVLSKIFSNICLD